MAKRLYNPRLAKTHRSYKVSEAADLYSVHRNTVRKWIKDGLEVCGDQKPFLIRGPSLRDFHARNRANNKQPCKPGEMYCMRCRVPRMPALDMAEYLPMTATGGNLIALCSSCEGWMYRRVSLAKLPRMMTILDITVPVELRHINKSS